MATARQEALLNRFADAVLDALKRIGRDDDATRWLTTPRTFRRGFFAGIAAEPRPAICVSVAGSKPGLRAARRHEDVVTLRVHVVATPELATGDLVAAAEREICRLYEDVMKAIVDDETLKAFPGLQLPLRATDFAPESELLVQGGLAVAIVTIEGTIVWDHADLVAA